jgi:predicted transglutaminase-like cysteine proteinase
MGNGLLVRASRYLALVALPLFGSLQIGAQVASAQNGASASADGAIPDQAPASPPLTDLDPTLDTLAVAEANQPAPPVTPEVFGTSAVLATRTTMDERWRQVHAPPVDSAALRALIADAPAGDPLQQAGYVETIVSKRIAFRSDWDNWKVEDYWATPDEVLARRAGDCEDSAVVKLAALRLLGIADRDLYLMIGTNRAGLEHAVLLVRVDGRFWVLDDGATRVDPADGFDTFVPRMSFAGTSTWIHGKLTQVQRPLDWTPDLGEPDPSLTVPDEQSEDPDLLRGP